MDNNVVIEFKNVSKIYKLFRNDKHRFLAIFFKKIKYKKKHAVNDVSFKVKKGEALAFLGRNGAGKSTILKMITGVTFPTSGEIKVEGRVSALLELTAGFDAEMTGRENIYLKGQLMGIPKSEVQRVEPAIVDFAELGDYIDQPVRTYSSGMKAKLGFAVNVNIEPEIFIVDEALSVGDANFKAKCLKRVNEIISQDDVTLIFVTHASGVAKEFCNRGIVLSDGKLVIDTDINNAVEKYREITGIANA
jgi:teichoic acid transport system ATP-binding protein